jgi:hypothetical protein
MDDHKNFTQMDVLYRIRGVLDRRAKLNTKFTNTTMLLHSSLEANLELQLRYQEMQKRVNGSLFTMQMASQTTEGST